MVRGARKNEPLDDLKFGGRAFDLLMEHPVLPVEIAGDIHVGIAEPRLIEEQSELAIPGRKQ